MRRPPLLIGRRPAVALAVAAIASLCGCSKTTPLVSVTGRVVFADERPVAAGTVEFRPRRGGPPARSALDADGRFVLTTAGRRGAIAGEHDVLVLQLAVIEGVEPHVHHRSATASPPRRVHPRHGHTGRSGLTARVIPDESNDLLITVEQQEQTSR